MVLKSIQSSDAWIRMNWETSFRMTWESILFAAKVLIPIVNDAEILIGDKGAGSIRVNPANNPEEKGMLQIRGTSEHFGGKVAILFNTKTNKVTVDLSKRAGLPAEYEPLATVIGPLMDMTEIRMYALR